MNIVKKNSDKILVLNKSNIMIKAKYNLNTIEIKLYLNILYNLQRHLISKNFDLNGDDDVYISIDRFDFKELVPGVQYLEPGKLIKLFGGLRSKNIYYKLNSKWEVFGFIEKAVYNQEDDTVVIKVDRFIADMLINYKDTGYTPLNLALMFGLEGMYSYRLYELIRLWSNTKNVITYSVDELKEYLMLEDKKSYNVYNNFKSKVILPSIEELNELEIFEISIKENKIGRKVDSIDFLVKDLDSRKYFDKKIDNKDHKDTKMKKSELTCVDNITSQKSIDKSYYVPDETMFTTGTLRAFKKDFKDYDFKKEYCLNAFEDSVMITLEKDEVENIKASSYKYFKATLINKLEEYRKEYEKDIKFKEELKKYW